MKPPDKARFLTLSTELERLARSLVNDAFVKRNMFALSSVTAGKETEAPGKNLASLLKSAYKPNVMNHARKRRFFSSFKRKARRIAAAVRRKARWLARKAREKARRLAAAARRRALWLARKAREKARRLAAIAKVGFQIDALSSDLIGFFLRGDLFGQECQLANIILKTAVSVRLLP